MCSSRTMALRFARRTVSLRCPIAWSRTATDLCSSLLKCRSVGSYNAGAVSSQRSPQAPILAALSATCLCLSHRMSVEREGDRRGSNDERSTQIRTAAVGVLAAVVVLVGGTLAITHPGPRTGHARPSADHPEWSVARRWDEALLDAIRRALPNPPVHARNLFHTSVAMWDAWAAYDPTASGYIVTEKAQAADVPAARDEAISYAAYRVLTSRYIKAVGGDESLSEFDDVMDALCYPIDVTTTEGNTPAAVGNRIAAAVLAYGKTDGSNEAGGYSSPDYRTGQPAARRRPRRARP